MEQHERIIRIEDKIDEIKESISKINTTLAAQHESLKEHMHRTELLEEAMDPIRDHIYEVRAGFKLASWVGMLIGIGAAIFEILGYFKH